MSDGRVVAGDRRPAWLYALLVCLAACAIVLTSATAALAGEDEPPNPMEDRNVLPVDQVGRYSLWRYEVGAGDPGALDVGEVIWSALTELFFWGSKGLVAIGEWVIEQAYSFDLVQELTDPAVRFADSLQREFVGPLELNHFALFLAIAYSGYQLFRRRTGLGLSELLISLLVAVFGAMLVAQPAWLVRSALPFTIDLSTGLLEVAMSITNDPTPGARENDPYRTAVRPLTGAIQHALIEQPYDLIAWGALLKGDCAVKRDEILANEAWDPDSTEARNHMRGGAAGAIAKGLDRIPDWLKGPAGRAIQDEATEAMPGDECERYADYNEQPTVERMGLALINLLVTAVAISLLALVALTVVGAQIALAGLLVTTPVAVVFGTVPGTGRQLLAKWGGNVMQTYVVIIAVSFLLSMLLVGTAVILGDGGGQRPLGRRYLILLLTVALIFRARRRLTAAVQYMTIRTAEKLQTRDAQGRTVGVAGRTTAMGLEPTFALVRATNPVDAMTSEVDRATRKQVEALWE
jgi:TrbL/VirB6 plasmid conjugal transfer protein